MGERGGSLLGEFYWVSFSFCFRGLPPRKNYKPFGARGAPPLVVATLDKMGSNSTPRRFVPRVIPYVGIIGDGGDERRSCREKHSSAMRTHIIHPNPAKYGTVRTQHSSYTMVVN